MKNPDDQDVDPEDIFEEIEPTEPESLEARIRAGEEVDPDELEERTGTPRRVTSSTSRASSKPSHPPAATRPKCRV